MSNKIKRRLPTKPGAKPVPTLLTNHVEEFGRRLYNILLDRGLSQSDLARKVYNETTTDARGYEVVVGKDRISSYVRGKVRPDPKTLKKIAETPRGEQKVSVRARDEAHARERAEKLLSTLSGTFTIVRLEKR